MRTIGVQKWKEQAMEALRWVKSGESVEVLEDGKAVAHLSVEYSTDKLEQRAATEVQHSRRNLHTHKLPILIHPTQGCTSSS